jgi:hypothetical protein
MSDLLKYLKKEEGIAHHGMGPSNFPAWAHCTRYKGEPVPEDDLTNRANIGTLMHLCFEKAITEGPMPQDILDFLSEEDSKGLQWALEWVADNTADNRESEKKVVCIDDDFNEVYFGTLDLQWTDEDGLLHILDLKTGNQRDYSLQLMGYALPAMEAKSVKQCMIHTLYTKSLYEDSMTVEYSECKDTIMTLLMDVTEEPLMDPMPCSYCDWCVNASSCSALNDGAVKVVQGYVDEIPFELETYHSSELTDPNQMAKAFWMAKKLKKWCESVEKHAKDMAITQGLPVPGTKVCVRSGSNSVKDVSHAYRLSGLSTGDFFSCCSLKMGALIDMVANNEGIKKSEAKIKVEELLQDTLVKGRGTKYLQLAKGAK